MTRLPVGGDGGGGIGGGSSAAVARLSVGARAARHGLPVSPAPLVREAVDGPVVVQDGAHMLLEQRRESQAHAVDP